ncbi:MAG: protein kinase [bacterium]|nr:protein kinase [bacterium]
MTNTASPASLIGRRYQVYESLGAGGMGVVYRAIDRQTGHPVAVKLLKPQAVSTAPEVLERFAREADALRQLNHPNIVKVLETIQENDLHYIIMEFVSGGSLHETIQREGKLSIKRVLEIGLDLADALSRAHRLKITHRDLKPANILIAADGSVRLTDFGVARIGTKERVTEIGTIVGTPDYMSPEALQGDEVDPRTDLWSLGVILYEMLAGHRPFRSENLSSVIISVLTHPTPDLEALRPDAPVALVDLIYRMLVKDREARIPSARLIGAELEAIQEGGLMLGGQTTADRTPLSYRSTTSEIAVVAEAAGLTPVRPTPTPHHNLPAQTAPFVGREAELTELSRLMRDPGIRHVTILGPGGMGKTRLSLAFAETIVGDSLRSTPITDTIPFADGVYFVALDAITNPDDIVTTVAEALSFTFQADGRSARQQLIDFLSEKHLLLIMDNFEHMLAGATLVSDLLRGAPYVRVLATSRERLNLTGETLFNLDGMDFPEWETPADAMEYSAVKLFLQGARRAKPGFELTADDLKYVARICRMVQGMPLGILLAAAWVETLALHEIADEIGRSLDFLESEMRDLPERHRSIRAVFEYSWNLMTEAERETFMKLALFRGGFERDAAQAVAGASLRVLTTLVNKSLLRRTPEGRYHIHELLRQYAEERFYQCCDQPEVRGAHSRYYADWLAKLESAFRSSEERQATERVEDEMENIRAALRWMQQDGRWDELEKTVNSLTAFFVARSRLHEGGDMFAEIAQELEAKGQASLPLYYRLILRRANIIATVGEYDTALRDARRTREYFASQGDLRECAYALHTISYVLMNQGEYAQAVESARESAAIAHQIDNMPIYLTALGNQGYGEYLRGNYDEAERLFREIKDKGRDIYATSGMATIINNLGEVLQSKGEFEQARQLFEEAYTTFKAYHQRRGMAFTLNNLGGICTVRGDYDSAQRKYEEAYRLNKEIGDRAGIGHSLSALGNIAFYTGDYARARQYYEESLRLRRALGDPRTISDSLSDLADVAFATNNLPEANRLYKESLEASRQIGDQAGIASAMVWVGITEGINADDPHDPKIRAYFDEGLRLAESVGEQSIVAQAVLGLAEMNYFTGNMEQAEHYYLRALRMATYAGALGLMLYPIIGLAGIMASRGETIPALEYAGLVQSYPRTFINFMTDMKVNYLIDQIASSVSPEQMEEALARGRRLDLTATVEHILASAPSA